MNSAPYTPEQNGKPERFNRTDVEVARSRRKKHQLTCGPKRSLRIRQNTAVYVRNRVTSKNQPLKNPFKIWNWTKPTIEHLKIFGTTAYMHVPKTLRRKMDAKSKKVLMVGYQGVSTNYRLFDPASMKIMVSRDVVFDEYEDKQHEEDNEELEKFIFPEETIEQAVEDPDLKEDDIESKGLKSRLRDRCTIKLLLKYQAKVAGYVPLTCNEAMKGPDAK